MTAARHGSICRRPARILFLVSAAAPLQACAAGSMNGYLDYLGTDAVIIAIFLSNTVLLLGFLIRLRNLGRGLSTATAVLEDREANARFVADNLPKMTLFQLECSPEGMFAFRYISEGFSEVLGLDRDRVIRDAKLVFDHLYEADLIPLQEAYQQARQALTPAELNLRMLDIHGNLLWLHISAVPHPENGFIVWDGIMRDISAGKKTESELMEERRNFHNLFETIDDLMLVCDMDGNLLRTNPSVEERLGYTLAEVKELSLFDLYPSHLRTEAYRIIAHMQTEQSTTSSLPFCTRHGIEIPVEMKLFQGSWENRKAIFGIARDATHRQQTESALRESKQMLQLIMDTIPMSVFWKNRQSECLGCNKAFIKECGLESAADVIGKKPHDLFDAETAAALIAHDRQVVAVNEPILNIMLPFRHADEAIGQHEASKIPLHNEKGEAVGVLEVWRDVTEQNQSEERLKRTLEDMERFNQLMRGRERRTLELKTEINQLLAELGRGTKYSTTSDGSA